MVNTTNDTSSESSDLYQQMREKIRNWIKGKGKNHKYAEYILYTPDLLHLLCKLSLDPDVPTTKKAKLGSAIAYFISPIDILPEAVLGPLGYLDDIALAALVLNDLVNDTNSEIVQKHWAGDGDVLQLIKRILAVADQMIDNGLWKVIKENFGFSTPD